MTALPKIYLLIVSFWLSSLLALPAVLAQTNDKTDTGGGMGGTGNRPEKGLMAEVGNAVSPGCEDSQTIGRIVRTRPGEGLMRPDEPLCIDREVQTSTTETALVVVTGHGEVTLDPNTAAIIRNATGGDLALHAKRGTFRGNHPDARLTYLIDTENLKRKIYLSGNRFILEVASIRINNGSLITDIKISALGDTPTRLRYGDETLTVKPPLKASVHIRGESAFLGSASP